MTEYTQLGIVGLFVAALLGARAALVRWGSGSWLRQQRPADVEVGARAVLAPKRRVRSVTRMTGSLSLAASMRPSRKETESKGPLSKYTLVANHSKNILQV